MRILVLNCGSSSVKYELFEMEPEQSIATGLAERIGELAGGALHHRARGHDGVDVQAPMHDHRAAIAKVIEMLLSAEHGALKSLDEIAAVGHRVVHGGERFAESVRIDDEVIAVIEECCDLAPLHNPPNLVGIRACLEVMPDTPQVAVFDTAFHHSMPQHAHLYGIPYEYYERYGIRRYGFHGTSHRYVTLEAARALMARGVPEGQQKIVTCHLGNGCSMAAVSGGRSCDTTMGFTPLEGLLMGTRCGDVDPAVPLFLMEQEGLAPEEMGRVLNKRSGLLGVSGVSNDLRDVLSAADAGNERAQAAIDLFCYRVRKCVGGFAAALGGLHAVVFTAGIGEHSPRIRAQVCDGLEFLGIRLDRATNEATRGPNCCTDISAADAGVRVLVIPTDEELMIARDTRQVISN